jgi:hypothetical protein
MTEPFNTVHENLAQLGLLKWRHVISLMLAALVYFGLYQYVGWTLDTGRAVAANAAASAVLALSVSVLSPRDSFQAALSVFIGMLGASVVVLFVIGPGNLFPIVIVFLGGLFAISTGVGWVLAQLVNIIWSGLVQSRHPISRTR